MALRQSDYGTYRALKISQALLAIIAGAFTGAIATLWAAAQAPGGLEQFATTILENPANLAVGPLVLGLAVASLFELLYVFVVVERWGLSFTRDLGLIGQPVDLWWAIGLTVVLMTGGYVILGWLLPEFGVVDSTGPESQIGGSFANATETDRLAFIAVVGLLVPFVEEVLFRGVILRALQVRVGAAGAIFGSAILFSIAHAATFSSADLPILAFAFFAGLLLAAASIHTGRIVACVAAHSVNNLIVAFVVTSA